MIFQCDNGKEFINYTVKEYLKKENIKMVNSRPHHPQTNGCIERYHHELHKFIYNYVTEQKNISDEIL